MYRLWEHGLGKAAAGDHQLLADVVRHKITFYHDVKARYELAVPGSLRLVPGEDVLAAIRPEYAAMAEEMIFGEAPGLDEVIRVLKAVESAING